MGMHANLQKKGGKKAKESEKYEKLNSIEAFIFDEYNDHSFTSQSLNNTL